jgi:hypothetical protein
MEIDMYYFVDNSFELITNEYDKNDLIEFRCEHCGKLYTKRYIVLISSGLLCKSCCQKLAFNNKDWSDRNLKSKLTKKTKYGDENYNNRTQAYKTCEEKYGNKISANSNKIKEQIKQKNMQLYGVEYTWQREDVKEKSRLTKIQLYNNPYYRNEDKIKETCREKYGTDYVVESEYFKKKSKQTCEEHGYNNGGYSEEARNKMHKKYTYENKHFDSAPELCYYIWLKDHNIDFEYQPNISYKYEYNNEYFDYFPDFIVNGEYIEIKGLHFFENKNSNGKMINPYDRTQDEKYEAKHQCMIKNNVKIITDYSNYENYINEKYTKDYIKLFRNDLEFPYLNENLVDKSDYGVIQHFHKSIYEATRKNKPSPINAWNDKMLIKKAALNRLKYVGRCKLSDILQAFNVAKIAPKISVFKPSLAQNLIEKYLYSVNEVFDPFSGFSGRMIGCENTKKTYIGQDIHEGHVKESNEIIKYKNYKNSTVIVKDIFNDFGGEYESLFTCPPYGGKEHWNKNNDEIEKTCDEWIELCLNKYKCKKYLFVVDKTEKYKNYIVETIENKSHFGSNFEYVILI